MFDGPDPQTWECQSCGREREKTKPGATEGTIAWMRCGECSERVRFECVSGGNT